MLNVFFFFRTLLLYNKSQGLVLKPKINTKHPSFSNYGCMQQQQQNASMLKIIFFIYAIKLNQMKITTTRSKKEKKKKII